MRESAEERAKEREEEMERRKGEFRLRASAGIVKTVSVRKIIRRHLAQT